MQSPTRGQWSMLWGLNINLMPEMARLIQKLGRCKVVGWQICQMLWRGGSIIIGANTPNFTYVHFFYCEAEFQKFKFFQKLLIFFFNSWYIAHFQHIFFFITRCFDALNPSATLTKLVMFEDSPLTVWAANLNLVHSYPD